MNKMKENINRTKLTEVNKEDSVQDIIEKSIRNILVCLGDDPDREGLLDTVKEIILRSELVLT